jgi:hypothetical protein
MPSVPTLTRKSAGFQNVTTLKGLCIAAVSGVLIATLWPFNPFPRNGVSWVRATSGLRFNNSALVLGQAPLALSHSRTPSYSLELLIAPASAKSLHTILAFYEPGRPRQFMIRQWNNSLLVTHDATVQSDASKTVKVDVEDVFRPGRLVLVTVSSGDAGTAVYLDGRLGRSFPNFKISGSELAGEIVLGTSPTEYYPWPGSLYGLAIYSKDLMPTEVLLHYEQWMNPKGGAPDLEHAIARYVFNETSGTVVRNQIRGEPDLVIPSIFSIPHKVLLKSAAKEFSADWTYASDVLMNIVGFLPIGFVVCLCLKRATARKEAVLLTTIACGLLSLMIEVAQYYIPRRVSGTTDIITNTLGAASGAMLTEFGPLRDLLFRMNLILKFTTSSGE